MARGFSCNAGDDPRRDFDCSEIGQLQGVPDILNEPMHIVHDPGRELNRCMDPLGGKFLHRLPNPGEFGQRGLAMRAALLVVIKFARATVGDLRKDVVYAVTAGEDTIRGQ
ncbi:MAG: hypothetical protein M3381_05650 [Actinomycetota bacterium]|nr:hypothetical protein [Actinomycetota bacterium]